MLTSRDEQIIEFLHDFRAARTAVLQQLFFPSYRSATLRLSELATAKEINRERDPDTHEFVYFVQKPRLLRHSLTLTDTYALFCRQSTVEAFSIEPDVCGIRPDALIAYTSETGVKNVAFIEVELSNKGLDIQKYIRLRDSGEYKKHFPVWPKLIVVTDKAIPASDLDVMVIPVGGVHGVSKQHGK